MPDAPPMSPLSRYLYILCRAMILLPVVFVLCRSVHLAARWMVSMGCGPSVTDPVNLQGRSLGHGYYLHRDYLAAAPTPYRVWSRKHDLPPFPYRQRVMYLICPDERYLYLMVDNEWFLLDRVGHTSSAATPPEHLLPYAVSAETLWRTLGAP